MSRLLQVLRRVTSLTVTLVALACGSGTSGPEPAAPLEVVDSAGVQLVRNLEGSVGAPAAGVIELLRIGAVEGDELRQFHAVSGLAVADDGRIYVADQGSLSIRVFDRSGRFVGRFGRRGEGPGEFTSIHDLVLWRDTVHAHDLRRLSGAVFDTAGVLLGTYRSLLADGTRIVPIAGGPRGWLVVHEPFLSRAGDERSGTVTRVRATIAHIEPSLLFATAPAASALPARLRPVAEHVGRRIFWQAGRDGLVRGNDPFFEPHGGYAADGMGRLYVASGWPYAIDVYDADGTHVRRISRAHEPVGVSGELVARVLRRATTHYDSVGPSGAASLQAYRHRAELPRVGFVPVVGRLVASPAGWLWVQRPDLEDDAVGVEWSPRATAQPLHWDVFDPDGVHRFTVRLPPRFTLRAVRADTAFGVLRDELDVQYVTAYTLGTPLHHARSATAQSPPR